MNLDANDLILFARIVDAGSISRVAEHSGVPKSTLSRRLSQLEQRLGQRLLTRSTRRLDLTEFGERLLDHARRLADETAAAAALVLHQQAEPSGLLRVSLPPNVEELSLLPFLLQFAERYPQVRLELDLSPRRVDLQAERFDLAIRVATRLPDDNTLVARKLVDLPQGLYASPAYLARHGWPEHPRDLLQHACLRLINGKGEATPWLLRCGQEQWEGMPDGPLAANSPPLQRALAAEGMGIVGLVEHFSAQWVAAGSLARVLPDWSLPTVTLWCVTAGRDLLPARTTAFIELLKTALQHQCMIKTPNPAPTA